MPEKNQYIGIIRKDNDYYASNCTVVEHIVIESQPNECYQEFEVIIKDKSHYNKKAFVTHDSLLINSSKKLNSCDNNNSIVLKNHKIIRMGNKINLYNITYISKLFQYNRDDEATNKIFQHDNNIIKEFDIKKFIDSRTQDNGKESYIETAYRNETFLYKMTKTILDYIEKLNIISYIKEIGLKYLHKIYYYAKDKSIYILSGVLIYFFLKMIWKRCFRNRFLLLDDDEI
jgi:hypothetical protein